jgi:hypothetical protein
MENEIKLNDKNKEKSKEEEEIKSKIKFADDTKPLVVSTEDIKKKYDEKK